MCSAEKIIKLSDDSIQVSDNKTADDESDEASEEKVVAVEDMWQLKKTWPEQNLFIFNNGLWADCVFVVGETPEKVQKFSLHRVLLSKASPVFDRMLYGGMAEKKEICVTDIEPQTFKHLMTFVYSGSLDMSTLKLDRVVGVCLASEKYMIVDLKRKCSDHLVAKIGTYKTYMCLKFAILLDLTDLADRAREIVTQRTDEVFAAPTFQEQFNDCEQDLVLELVQQPILHIETEVELIKAVLSWAKHEVLRKGLTADPEGYKEALGPVLQYLRFYSLTPKEFARLNPLLSLLFSADEKLSILVQITLEDFASIPSTLSQNFEKRTKTVVNVPKFLTINEFNTVKYTCSFCKKCFFGTPRYQSCLSCKAGGLPAIVSDSKFSSSLFIKVDVDIKVRGLCLADMVPDLTVQVFRDSTIPIDIGNYHSTVKKNEIIRLRLESPFTVKANTSYTISLSSLSGCFHEKFVSRLNDYTGSNLFTKSSFKTATNEYAIIMGIYYKKI